MDEQQALESATDVSLARFLAHAGTAGVLALVCGVVVLVLALRCAARRGPRGHAYALFAAAWLAFVPVLASESVGEARLLALTTHWSYPNSDLIARFVAGPTPDPVRSQVCAVGLFLGLAGAVAALARSRADAAGPRPASGAA